MPLPQPLPEDVTKEGRALAVEGVQNGLGWAMKNKQLGLEEEMLKYKQDALAQQKAQNVFSVGLKYAELIEKTRKLPPSVGKAMMKAYGPQLESLGFPMSETTKAMILDPEASKSLLGFHNALLASYEKGDLTEAAPQVQAYMETFGSESGPDALEKFMENQAATERSQMAAKEAGARQEKSIQSQEGRFAQQQGRLEKEHKESLDFQKGKFRDEKINRLKEDAQAIQKEFGGDLGMIRNIAAINKKDPQFKNPQSQLALARMSVGLSETRNSAVLEGEMRQVQGGIGILGRFRHWVENKKEGDTIPLPIAKDIVRMSNILGTSILAEKKARMDGIRRAIVDEGFMGEAGQILGEDIKLFKDLVPVKPKLPPEKSAKGQKAGAKAINVTSPAPVQPTASDIAGYRKVFKDSFGIEPTEAQLQRIIKMKMSKGKK